MIACFHMPNICPLSWLDSSPPSVHWQAIHREREMKPRLSSCFLLGSVLFLLLLCCWRAAAQAQQPPQTDPIEAAAVNAILSKLGLSAPPSWNISGNPCSGAATDDTSLDDNPNFNPAIKCDCSDQNNTLCHITRLKIRELDAVGPIPEELRNLTHLMKLSLKCHLVYVTGWSVYTEITLIRDGARPRPGGDATLGELLKRKAREGVHVLMLVWDDRTSVESLGMTRGFMQTHDAETAEYFRGSGVHYVLCPRNPDAGSSAFMGADSLFYLPPPEDHHRRPRHAGQGHRLRPPPHRQLHRRPRPLRRAL